MYFSNSPLRGKAFASTRNFVLGLSFALVAMSGQSRADDGVRIPDNLCFWSVAEWSGLNSAEKAAWSGLGWSKQIWDGSDTTAYPASYRKSWSDLVGKEKKFAALLGYSSETWGVEECPNLSTLAQKKKVDPAPAKRKTVVSKSVRKKTSLLPPVHKNAGVTILGGMSSSVE